MISSIAARAASEIGYAPDGTWTGERLGASSNGSNGSNGRGPVTLPPGGVTTATVWVADTADTADQNGRTFPFINGALPLIKRGTVCR